MLSHELLNLFREEVFDLEAPHLWSREFVYQSIDEAQHMFCRLTDGIADATSSAAQLELKAGDPWATLSPLVLQIRNVHSRIEVVPQERFFAECGVLDDRTGTPRQLVTGMEEGLVRVVPVPVDDAVVGMSVFRLPRTKIDGPNQRLEIRHEYHRGLLDWMKHLAYGKQDADAYDRSKSDEFELKFRAFCLAVKAEQARRRRVHEPILYGGL